MVRTFLILSAGLLLFGCAKKPQHAELAAFINREYEAHPRMEMADLYKLLYQAEFGPGHLLANADAAKEYLLLEAKSRGPNSSQPLTEPCSPDGSVIRVNLAPFLARNLSFDDLFTVMKESAGEISGSEKSLRSTWRQVGELIDAFAIPFPKERYQEFSKFVQDYKFPEVHHSREYTLEYHPSYRVVKKSIFEKYFPASRTGTR
jgi:hypothetical protein